MNAWQGGWGSKTPKNLLYVIGMVYITHAIKSREKYLRAWFQEFLSTLGKLLGFFHAYIGATFIMVYKGCMILKTRGIPYYFQNFGSFHPLLFFQMMEKCLSPEYAKIRVNVIPWFFPQFIQAEANRRNRCDCLPEKTLRHFRVISARNSNSKYPILIPLPKNAWNGFGHPNFVVYSLHSPSAGPCRLLSNLQTISLRGIATW